MAETNEDRQRRLAQALRDNLRRRKAQARAGANTAEASKPDVGQGRDPQ